MEKQSGNWERTLQKVLSAEASSPSQVQPPEAKQLCSQKSECVDAGKERWGRKEGMEGGPPRSCGLRPWNTCFLLPQSPVVGTPLSSLDLTVLLIHCLWGGVLTVGLSIVSRLTDIQGLVQHS